MHHFDESDTVVSRSVPRLRRTMDCIAAPAVLIVAAAFCSPALAQQWIGATGSWYDGLNWDPAVVPVAGGSAVVSNGGTALLDTAASGGATSTPVLGSLQVGSLGLGTGVGTVRSQGVDLRTGALVVGSSAVVGGSFADGLVETTAAGVAVASLVRIGTTVNDAGPIAASGQVLVDGSFQLTAPAGLEVGQMFGVGAGSAASGRLVARDLSGTVGSSFLIVGNVTGNGVAEQIGSRSTGEVVASEGGLLTLAGGVSTVIGTTFGTDRVSDAAGTRINEATGALRLAGTLATGGNQGSLLVGRAFGGAVDGTLDVGTLAMGSDRFSGVSVGSSTEDGVARGRVAAASGDLRQTGTLFVGHTLGGTAEGAIDLGGALLGDGTGNARVGVAGGSGGRVVQATGAVNAAGGIAGYRVYEVGALSGDIGAGSTVSGQLIGVGDAGSSNVQFAYVGRMFNTTAAGSVDGEMRLGGSLGLVNGFLEVAQTFGVAAGSNARGVLHVGGDVGQVQGAFLIVGNVTGTGDATVGSRSFGELVAGGGATLAANLSTIVGTTFGTDRVVDAAGTRINEATGVMRIGGTLATLGDQASLLVGRSFNGLADGTLEVGTLAMGSDRFGFVAIGTTLEGSASGRVTVGGGTLRAGAMQIGNATTGTATGALTLNGADLDAESVFAGQGTGEAMIELHDSLARVGTNFDLGQGTLALARSRLEVGNELRLGQGATLRLGIGGLLRGTEFGAIDTLLGSLGGQLSLDLSALSFDTAGMVFDLIFADDDLSGDFASVSFLGLDARFVATTGIFAQGDGEVYRLSLQLAQVPEPTSAALVLLALLALGLGGGRARRRAGA